MTTYEYRSESGDATIEIRCKAPIDQIELDEVNSRQNVSVVDSAGRIYKLYSVRRTPNDDGSTIFRG